jgi:hypothetical protein
MPQLPPTLEHKITEINYYITILNQFLLSSNPKQVTFPISGSCMIIWQLA